MPTDANKSTKVSPAMVKAGLSAWWNESAFWGPPDVDGEEIVIAIFKAMTSLYDAKSESIFEE